MKTYSAIRFFTAALLALAMAAQLTACKKDPPEQNPPATSASEESTAAPLPAEPTAEELINRVTAAMQGMDQLQAYSLQMKMTAKISLAGITAEVSGNLEQASDHSDREHPIDSSVFRMRIAGEEQTTAQYYTADGFLYVNKEDGSALCCAMRPEEAEAYMNGEESDESLDFLKEFRTMDFQTIRRTQNEDGSTTITFSEAKHPKPLSDFGFDLQDILEVDSPNVSDLVLSFTLTGETDTICDISLAFRADGKPDGDEDELPRSFETSIQIAIRTESVTVAVPEDPAAYTEVQDLVAYDQMEAVAKMISDSNAADYQYQAEITIDQGNDHYQNRVQDDVTYRFEEDSDTLTFTLKETSVETADGKQAENRYEMIYDGRMLRMTINGGEPSETEMKSGDVIGHVLSDLYALHPDIGANVYRDGVVLFCTPDDQVIQDEIESMMARIEIILDQPVTVTSKSYRATLDRKAGSCTAEKAYTVTFQVQGETFTVHVKMSLEMQTADAE